MWIDPSLVVLLLYMKVARMVWWTERRQAAGGRVDGRGAALIAARQGGAARGAVPVPVPVPTPSRARRGGGIMMASWPAFSHSKALISGIQWAK